jgi:hypothetical protein
MPTTASERERDEDKPKLQSDGAGARDGGRRTRNGTGEPGRGQPGRFRAGQNVICTVLEPFMDGYLLIVPGSDLNGYIKTKNTLATNQEILAQFVCVSQGRIFLVPPFLKPDK